VHLSVVQLSSELPCRFTPVTCERVENSGPPNDGVIDGRSFDLSEPAEHVVGGVDTAGGTSDTDLEAPEVLRVERSDQ